jgi:hypothetical protein
MSVIGPASLFKDDCAVVSLEFSKEILQVTAAELITLSTDQLKKMHEGARIRSTEIVKELKDAHLFRDLAERYKPGRTLQGELPDGVDSILGQFALDATTGLVTCIVFIQTSYDSPWDFCFCILGNAALSYYAVFNSKTGSFQKCNNVDVDIRRHLEVEKDGIYYRAFFVRSLPEVAPVATVTKRATPAKKKQEPEEKKPEQKETEKKEPEKKEPEKKEESEVATEEKPKKRAPIVRKRPAPTLVPTAATQPEEKKAAPDAPPPPAATTKTE